jgi:membrane protein
MNDAADEMASDTRPVTGGDGPQVGPDAAEAKPRVGNGRSPTDRARRGLAAAHGRYEGSWIQAVVTQLKVLDAGKWTTVFGAELLWSMLPLLILLSSLANAEIDGELSRHIGVSGEGAQIVRSLLRNSPIHPLVPILTGLIFALVGAISLANSVQVLYERSFDQPPRGWRDTPRLVVWLVALVGVLAVAGTISKAALTTTGPVTEWLERFILATLFFWWTMHFLLAGRIPWRVLIRPALVTAALWLVLAALSPITVASSIVEDSRLYGTIGVVFTLLTWFILVATVVVLGATFGAVWEKRRG